MSFRDESHEFRRVVEKLERNPVCQRLPLRSFLILPFQRITRLKLLVQVLSSSVLLKYASHFFMTHSYDTWVILEYKLYLYKIIIYIK